MTERQEEVESYSSFLFSSDRVLDFELCLQQIPEASESAELLEILKTQTCEVCVCVNHYTCKL